jgi:hypothetical protein
MTSSQGSFSQGSNEKIFMYASIFLYKPKARHEYSTYAPSITSYEGISSFTYSNSQLASNMLPAGSSGRWDNFLRMNDEDQRKVISDVRIIKDLRSHLESSS